MLSNRQNGRTFEAYLPVVRLGVNDDTMEHSPLVIPSI